MISDNIRYGGGILFYCKSLDNTPYFLLGKDKDNRWSNFGGTAELSDKCDPETTSVRETWEETLGSIGDQTELRKLIRGGQCIMSKTPSGHKYYMYIVRLPFTTIYRDRFNTTKKFLSNITIDKKFAEILDVKLISLETIKYSIEHGKQKTFIRLRSSFEQTIQNNFEEICGILNDNKKK